MRSTPIFKKLYAAVLAAVVVLLGVQTYRYFHRPLSVSAAYTSQVSDSISVTGWVVRQETALPEASGTLLRQVREGEKVHAGQTVAVSYASKSALETVKELEDAELKLQQLQFARSSFLDSDAALRVDSDVSDSILGLRTVVAGGDYSVAAEAMAGVKTAVLKRSYSYESLDQIDAEIESTRSSISSLQDRLSGATAVQTAAAGYFSGSTDGCEGTLTPAFLEGVTPSQLNGLSASAAVKSAGKIITSSTWYYAAVLPAAEAEELEVGQEVTLRLSKGLKQDAPAHVQSISNQEDGQVAVVFACTRYISQVTLLRRQQAEIILREYSGIRIPTAALRMDESGQLGVYCQIGASGERALRQGDLVISTAQQLTDGMILPDS